MSEPPHADLTILHGLAQEYAAALAWINAPLPDEFPIEQMREIARLLSRLNGLSTEDEQRALVYARHKLRETRKIISIHLRDPEAPSYFDLARAHNALFAEVDGLIEAIPPPILLELQPSSRDGLLVVRRAELAGIVDALVRRARSTEDESRDALHRVRSYININIGNINIDKVEFNLKDLITATTTLSAELKASLIELPSVADLIKRIDEVAKSLGQALESIRKGGELAERIIASADEARRLAERVVAGGKTLLGWIRRTLKRQPADSSPFRVFRDIDAPWCPELVVLPAGSFIMGGPQGGGPEHEVTITHPFAVGRYPVTFEEYDHFTNATGAESADDNTWGRGRRPVINVSWYQARAYVEWLSRETGKAYRLLSEAEWEYACRAGTTTLYSWGDEGPNRDQATFETQQSTEVDRHPANPWQLHDMHGNVWEWVEDCWHEFYDGAPTDGSAWTSDDCESRGWRGGSWYSEGWRLYSAFRAGNPATQQSFHLGFRIARTL